MTVTKQALPPIRALPAIRSVDAFDPAMQAAIVGPLAEASTVPTFSYAPKFITLGLCEDCDVDGGLSAQIYWDWMTIQILAVPERLRGRGLGRGLVEEAERIARESGCRGVWVDTYSFQSPGFYERLGYRPFGRLPDYPAGQTRLFYAKLFGENESAGEE